MIFHQDDAIDELNKPLVPRWSRHATAASSREQEADWPEGEEATLTKTEARASLRKARSKPGREPAE